MTATIHSLAGPVAAVLRRLSTVLGIAVIVYFVWYDTLAPANETVEALVTGGVLVVAVATAAVLAVDLRQDIRTYRERYR